MIRVSINRKRYLHRYYKMSWIDIGVFDLVQKIISNMGNSRASPQENQAYAFSTRHDSNRHVPGPDPEMLLPGGGH